MLTSFLKSIIVGQTGVAHSVIFVFETLVSENNFISDIDEDLRCIFVFGYYLKRKGFVVTLYAVNPSSMHTEENRPL